MRKNMKGKRENSDSNGGPDNKRNRRDVQNDKNAVRLLIPSTIAGAVIGKGGQHIQRMRTQYKATVSVDDSQGPERTILISTDLDSTLQIISEMLKYFEEQADEEYDVRLLIHKSLAGCVIGKGGQKIKEIRDKIGCRILKVFSNVAPESTDRVVQTVGKQDQVINAIRDIITLIGDTPIKGPVQFYEPRNFNRMYADDYGGYGNMVGNNNGRNSRPNQRGGGGGGNGGGGGGGGGFGGNNRGGQDRNRNDRSRSNGRRDNPFVNPWANQNNNNNNGGGGGYGGNNNNMGGGGGGGFPGNFGGNNGGGGGNSVGFAPNFGNNNFGNSNMGNNFSNPPGFNQGGGFGGNTGNNAGGSNLGTFGNQGGNLNNPNPGFGNNMNPAGNGAGGGFSSGQNAMGNSPNSGGNTSFGDNGNNNSGNNLPNGHDPKNSTQVTIPKDLAGAIIGKGGGRIRRIRNDSGAYITIDEPLPGSTDRIITISGSPKQIQMAQYLLQQSVHESSGGNRRNF